MDVGIRHKTAFYFCPWCMTYVHLRKSVGSACPPICSSVANENSSRGEKNTK